MEVSMTMYMNDHKLLQRFHKNNPPSKNPRIKSISCQLAAMQNGTKTNFYQILSLSSSNVGLDEIKRAYRSMALHYHPDVCTAPLTKAESTRRFIEIRKAYDTLSDPKSRQNYDRELGLDGSRKVWERQLHGLRKKCDERTKIRRCQEFMWKAAPIFALGSTVFQSHIYYYYFINVCHAPRGVITSLCVEELVKILFINYLFFTIYSVTRARFLARVLYVGNACDDF